MKKKAMILSPMKRINTIAIAANLRLLEIHIIDRQETRGSCNPEPVHFDVV
jgi:hypothetical protein